jgi:hypothetical protein
VDAYLPAVVEAGLRHFPGATVRLEVEEDPEIEELRHIVVFVSGFQRGVQEFLVAKAAYHRELFAVVPAPLVCTFRLGLE